MDSLVTLSSFWNPVEANIAKSKLEAHGIFSVLFNENYTTLVHFHSIASGGVLLKVRKEDAEEAIILLSENKEINQRQTEILLIDKQEETCPKCGSDNFGNEKYSKFPLYFSILLLGFPLPFLSKKKHCFDCGHDWKKANLK